MYTFHKYADINPMNVVSTKFIMLFHPHDVFYANLRNAASLREKLLRIFEINNLDQVLQKQETVRLDSVVLTDCY